MRIFKIAAVMFVLAAGLAVAVTFPAARAAAADAVAVRDGRALIVGASGTVLRTLSLGAAVGAATVSPDGGRIAATVGDVLPGGPDGVQGQVVIADARTGAPLLRTKFANAHIGGVAWGAGGRVALVKDWYELWLLDPSSGRLGKIADGREFSPARGGASGMLFSPVFDRDGTTVVVGRVEQTFDGEDDALDNLWSVDSRGAATRLSALTAPAGGWRIARSPLALGDGTVVFTSAASDAASWEVAALNAGRLWTLAVVAADSYLAGVGRDGTYLLVMDPRTGAFDLVRSNDGGTVTLLRGVSGFDLPDVEADLPAANVEPERQERPGGVEQLTAQLGRLTRPANLGR